MRKVIMIVGAAAIFASCGNPDIETKTDVITTDTTGMYKSNVSTDTGAVITTEEPAPVVQQPKTIVQTRTVYVDRPVKANNQKPVPQPQTQDNTTPRAGTGNTTTTTGNETSTGTGTTTAPVEKDKGMSNSTKGAVIGGVGGAVAGAVISKKKGKGAIIGGVIGAAGGYILGKKKDKAQADTTNK